MNATLRPLSPRYPWGLDLIADTLADADLFAASRLRTREHYYLIDAATLAERVEVTR